MPSPGTIDPTITDVNYLSVQYVAEMLLRALRRGAEQTSARVDQCDGQPRARAVLLEILADERRHIDDLVELLRREGARLLDERRGS